MSDNDCCGMLISCCFCCALCGTSSGSGNVVTRWLVNLCPDSWCTRLEDTSAADAAMAERDQEANLFQAQAQTSAQPPSVPATAMNVNMNDVRSGGGAGGAGIRDKSHIMSDD
ncbi:hypothetical protein B0H15DRAFT_952708 [Mycena belliarum]|uniref:Uncharacterized protein n=1 Tax=Mycena belliarum TaxID=1033014 RepID=A0AAD6TWP5_9AGAR|nr:hypothetical protein B0H15DRAFT_952708 [Mycena belliae]